ncbi:hypothetical protein F5I97DRAFT_1800316, partial [Phlebopus sp. FC_14]
LLEVNPIFNSTKRKPQQSVHYQLAYFLLRYGSHGADPLQAVHKLGIGFGTVFVYCKHIVHALRELDLHVVTWGNDE